MNAQRIGFAAALAALFAGTALFRFMALSAGFTNDQFLHLAGAQQVLLGEWPTRDFLDAGMPLMYYVSALAQLLFGRTLFAEAFLVSTAFGLAAVFTALAVRELTGSRWLGIAVAILEVLIAPRSYGYPKLLTHAVGLYLVQRYVSRPSTARLAALAAAVTVAFLFRHDHGIYLSVAAALAVFTIEPTAARGLRRLGALAGMGIGLVLPYLIYVQVNGGLWRYMGKGLEFRAREFERAQYAWPELFAGSHLDLQVALLYQYWAFPLAAVLILAAFWRRPDWRTHMARVGPIVVIAVLLNIAFARPPYEARLPDAIVPAVLLAAWLAWMAWQPPRRWTWRLAAVAGGILLSLSIPAANRLVDQRERADLLVPLPEWPRVIGETHANLVAPHVLVPSATQALTPLYDYAGRCTSPDQRVLVVGIIPEVPFFTRRGFAGGQAILVAGYYDDEAYQRSTLEALGRQTVPFVIIHGAAAPSFETSFPLVADHVRERYVPLATLGNGDPSSTSVVLVDKAMATSRSDPATGWPCVIRR
jgi:hypothetical protein